MIGNVVSANGQWCKVDFVDAPGMACVAARER